MDLRLRYTSVSYAGLHLRGYSTYRAGLSPSIPRDNVNSQSIRSRASRGLRTLLWSGEQVSRRATSLVVLTWRQQIMRYEYDWIYVNHRVDESIGSMAPIQEDGRFALMRDGHDFAGCRKFRTPRSFMQGINLKPTPPYRDAQTTLVRNDSGAHVDYLSSMIVITSTQMFNPKPCSMGKPMTDDRATRQAVVLTNVPPELLVHLLFTLFSNLRELLRLASR